MNNLNKSVLLVNKLIGLLLGDNFSTPIEKALEEYPDIRFLR
ncbi:MAG: hypothetical protein Q8O43_10330 [Dehalococcoidia bacterium]|nr:hypothetical protein [Dehalococcoidia bacterium]